MSGPVPFVNRGSPVELDCPQEALRSPLKAAGSERQVRLPLNLEIAPVRFPQTEDAKSDGSHFLGIALVYTPPPNAAAKAGVKTNSFRSFRGGVVGRPQSLFCSGFASGADWRSP